MERLLHSLAALLFAACAAMPGTSFAGSHAQVGVSARVLTYFRVSEVSHPPVVEVEEHHLRQGYVDLEAGSSVSLESNATSPVAVRVAYDASFVRRVSLRVGATEVTAERSGETGLVPNPVRGKRRVPVAYRLYLQPGVSAGSRAWPVALAFTPTL